VVVWVTFSLSEQVAKAIGKTGTNVMTRLMGLLLAALAVRGDVGRAGQALPGARGRRALDHHDRSGLRLQSSAAAAPPAACWRTA